VIEPNKHKAVNAAKGDPLRRCAPQNVELMPEQKDFGF
jgi:hypothetical protein